MPVSIDIDQQEASPFQQEPRLIGFYHWNRSVRTMHQHENCIELNFMLSGNGTHIVGNEICHTQPGDIIVYDSKIMHDESLMLDSLTDACCIAVTGLQRPGARPNALLPPGTHPCILPMTSPSATLPSISTPAATTSPMRSSTRPTTPRFSTCAAGASAKPRPCSSIPTCP